MGTEAHSSGRVLDALARDAPPRAGVYILLAADRELLYVGKAANLRRRLLDHARSETKVSGGRTQHVGEVHWVECADEREALCLEADLIVALAPRFNAVMADEPFTFVCVDPSPKGPDRIRIRLTEDESTKCSRMYGAFAHMGKGKYSWRAVRTNAGYSALLRVVWVVFGQPDVRFRIPAKVRGSSPPILLDASIDPSRLPTLHDFLSGRSSRLMTQLRESVLADDVPAFMRRPLGADLEAAEEFYRLGPRAVRQLRRRHGVGPGPVDRGTFTRFVSEDLRQAIGTFRVPERDEAFYRVRRRSPRAPDQDEQDHRNTAPSAMSAHGTRLRVPRQDVS